MFIFSNAILEIQNLGATFIDDDIVIRLAGLLQLTHWHDLSPVSLQDCS
jgi:hypothetical protein